MKFTTQNIGELVFYEKVNIKKLKYIIKHPAKYEKIIVEDEKEMRRYDKNYNAYAVFQKIKENIIVPEELKGTDYGFIKVIYKKGKNSKNIGRWYANKSLGIAPLCGCVRSSICDGIWVDIDQVNSHPTILKHFTKKYNFETPILDRYLEKREQFLQKVVAEEPKCNNLRSKAKTLIIAVINGDYYASSLLKSLYDELQPIIEYIVNLPEYSYILDYVKENYDKNINGKTISRILQVVENDLLMNYLDFMNSKNLIPKYKDGYQVALIFDGFQLLVNEAINDTLLNECRLYALEKTGYDVELKIKPFENKLDFPEDFNLYDDEDLLELIDVYETGINNKFENLLKDLNKCLQNITDASICNFSKLLFGETIIYDESCSLWFYCDIRNIWNKSKTGFIYKGLLKSIVNKYFMKLTLYYNQLAYEAKEQDKEIYQEKAKKSSLIAHKLEDISFLEKLEKMAKIDFNRSHFYEKKLDSKGYLFAFRNKVLDCQNKEVRYIKPDDYIMTNTGYDYPEFIDEDLKIIIEDYYKTIYPEDDMREYMWDNDALLMNGERLFQTFNIHTGSGSNSKSTKFAMIKAILGEYFCEVNADTLTKPAKTANSTSELYKAKGSRIVFFNEPENENDSKLQTSLLKKLADGYKGTLKTRGLWQDAIEFPIFFRLEGCCNKKPNLSSTDGGIARRVRVIDYPVKFLNNPDPNDKYQAELNLEMGTILSSTAMRNTYAKLLVERFINISFQIKKETIPKRIIIESKKYVEESNPVLGFILDYYDITNNKKDKISSNELFNDFRMRTGIKMTAKAFKDFMEDIAGIIFERNNKGSFFTCLIQKVEEEEP